MKLSRKHNRIGILMIVSQVLLTGFALYWLIGQFDKEKEELYFNITAEYKTSYMTLLDSMLVENYIEPALGERDREFFSYGNSEKRIVFADSLRYMSIGDSLVKTANLERGIVKINVMSGDTTGSFSDKGIDDIEKELLLRSVRLIVQHADDSSNHIRAFHDVESDIDSSLFISDFESRLENEAIDVQVVWIGDSSANSKLSHKNNIVIGDWTDTVPSISVARYRPYLFGQILPQILFVLLLILLTGSAFILAYNSLRKQTLLNDMRSSFISNISHELKTPVSTVKVAIEAIRNFDLKKDAKLADEYLEMASKEIIRLELLITKVLDDSIIEQDSSILRFEKTDLPGIIEDAISSLTPKINDAGGKVKFKSPGKIEIDGDPLYLQGVFINLIDNSLKYGNGSPFVEIDMSRSEELVTVIVSDNGPGIPDEYLSKVFEKFFRVPTQDIHNVKGYGLGLSFVALILEMHGGTIKVRNNDVGCSFTINLPVNKG